MFSGFLFWTTRKSLCHARYGAGNVTGLTCLYGHNDKEENTKAEVNGVENKKGVTDQDPAGQEEVWD